MDINAGRDVNFQEGDHTKLVVDNTKGKNESFTKNVLIAVVAGVILAVGGLIWNYFFP